MAIQNINTVTSASDLDSSDYIIISKSGSAV